MVFSPNQQERLGFIEGETREGEASVPVAIHGSLAGKCVLRKLLCTSLPREVAKSRITDLLSRPE